MVRVAETFSVWPIVMPPRFGVMATATLLATMVTVTEAIFAEFATDVARNVRLAGVGMELGAVKVAAAPEALEVGAIVPHWPSLQLEPIKVQVTPLLRASFRTVAVNCWVPFGTTLAEVGEIMTEIDPAGAVTVIVAAADFEVSETEVAVNVTAAGTGTEAGAVYTSAAPDAVEVADSVPQKELVAHPAPERLQVTPLLALSFCTVAVKLLVPLFA